MGYFRQGKAIYFRNEGEVVGEGAVAIDDVHIADAENEEKADFILNSILTRSTYFIKDAIKTCSPDFHANRVSMAQFRGRVNGAIDALNKLDQVKKSLFYGHDNNLLAEGQTGVTQLPARIHSDLPTAYDIIHAILGIATEAGELLELLKKTYNGEEFDWVNAQEEMGDVAWYEALLANRGGFEFEDFEQRIIKKLRQRYADKFTASEATERDLAAERAILEDKEAPLADMQDEGDSLASPPRLLPTMPVGGMENVQQAEEAANNAFDAINAVEPNMVEQPTGTNNELSKGIGERERLMPGEELAHQPVRREDLE